jgi:hypothetical protein
MLTGGSSLGGGLAAAGLRIFTLPYFGKLT